MILKKCICKTYFCSRSDYSLVPYALMSAVSVLVCWCVGWGRGELLLPAAAWRLSTFPHWPLTQTHNYYCTLPLPLPQALNRTLGSTDDTHYILVTWSLSDLLPRPKGRTTFLISFDLRLVTREWFCDICLSEDLNESWASTLSPSHSLVICPWSKCVI